MRPMAVSFFPNSLTIPTVIISFKALVVVGRLTPILLDISGIVDCPVSDMKWMVEEEMRKMDIGLPISYMTFCGNIINKMELGFSYDDANVCNKIADIEIPVLVINSEADTLTPQFMGQEIYDSIQNEEIKMIWTVTDSEHTEIWLDHNQEYREKVQELLNFTK